jgi:hypothetical protein
MAPHVTSLSYLIRSAIKTSMRRSYIPTNHIAAPDTAPLRRCYQQTSILKWTLSPQEKLGLAECNMWTGCTATCSSPSAVTEKAYLQLTSAYRLCIWLSGMASRPRRQRRTWTLASRPNCFLPQQQYTVWRMNQDSIEAGRRLRRHTATLLHGIEEEPGCRFHKCKMGTTFDFSA